MFFVMILTSMTAMCQNEVVSAVLQTGSEVKYYTGADALVRAYNDAEQSGSVITLTAGSFSTPSYITKSVNIYGQGWEKDDEAGIRPTVINGNLYFYSGSDETPLSDLTVEGVYVTGEMCVKQTTGLVASKFRAKTFVINGENASSITLRQCYLDGMSVGSNSVNGLYVQNSFIRGRLYGGGEQQILMDHCILRQDNDYGSFRAVYTNCIFGTGYRTDIDAGSTVKNCIFEGGSTSAGIQENCWFGVSVSTLFTDGTNMNYAEGRTFGLSSPETYVGTDGTEVGINGGTYPWNRVPTTPIVKKLEISVDGKQLNVTHQAETR